MLDIIPSFIFQREEQLEARHLALQKTVEQQIYPKTGEEEGTILLLYNFLETIFNNFTFYKIATSFPDHSLDRI